MKTEHPMHWSHSGNTPSKQLARHESASQLAIFVYGTLKSAQKNHEYFCGGATQIQPATTLGRLYALPAGYPALEVPEQHILAHGSADPLADTALQSRIACDLANLPGLSRPSGDWDQVHGEIITFTNPLQSLPPIDRLEGFHPGHPSFYQRILLPVFSNKGIQCCGTYIMPGSSKHHRIRTGIW